MIILGAKGLAKELLSQLAWNGELNNIFLFDNVSSNLPNKVFEKFQILTSFSELGTYFQTNSREFCLGIGDIQARIDLAQKAISLGGELKSIISKQALIGQYDVKIGPGVTILAQSMVTTSVDIGEGTLINKSVIVSHDVIIGAYCVLSPGVKVLGGVAIGEETEIGTNAVILPGVSVGTNCVIGAGAVVNKDVPDNTTVVGVPAKPLQRKYDH
jgi:sugar O-acyltransferase (sialic acid O-acetyltransferase NeuD family)